jgi:hypothetical protein
MIGILQFGQCLLYYDAFLDVRWNKLHLNIFQGIRTVIQSMSSTPSLLMKVSVSQPDQKRRQWMSAKGRSFE